MTSYKLIAALGPEATQRAMAAMSDLHLPECFVCGREVAPAEHVCRGDHRGRHVVVHRGACEERFDAEHDGLMDLLQRQFQRAEGKR